MKGMFKNYIETESSAPNSSTNYISGLNVISKIINKDIFQITSATEIKNLIEDLKNNEEFIAKDKIGDKMYSNAIKQYLNFLEFSHNIQMDQNTNIVLNNIQIILTKELLKTVINSEPNVTYKELAERVTMSGYALHHRQVGKNIGEISKLCVKLGLPMLSAKVMNQDSHIAGEGFFDLYKELHKEIKGDPKYIFKKELDKIRNCQEWYKLTDYLNIEIDGIERPKDKKETTTKNDLSNKLSTNFISEIENTQKEETEKQALIKIRLGHSKLRDEVVKNKEKCEICSLNHNKLLIASHIKPWSKSDNIEKLDSENILLLCSMHDALFDKGLISFDDYGNILISNELSETDKALVNINDKSCINITSDKQKEYLKYHRENIFIK